MKNLFPISTTLRPTLSLALCTLLILLCMKLSPQHQGQPARSLKASRPAGLLPDPRLTPGASDPAVTQANIHSTICQHGYTRLVRPPFQVSNRLKHQVMDLYHVAGSTHDYELDHLVPLELGGSPTALNNLWPQSWTSPGAHEKDNVELYLHDRVCQGSMTLLDAQHAIATDWYAVYLSINHLQDRL
jgi:hypothetical protein